MLRQKGGEGLPPHKKITAAKLRKQVDAEVYEVLSRLEKEGKIWLQTASHKAMMMCAVEGCPGWTHVPGTSSRPKNAAVRLERWARRCPDH